jgi:hypothetical protein
LVFASELDRGSIAGRRRTLDFYFATTLAEWLDNGARQFVLQGVVKLKKLNDQTIGALVWYARV